MKQMIEVFDKEIELEHGDKVQIYVRKKEIAFHIYCNYDGCIFSLTKEELKEMIKC